MVGFWQFRHLPFNAKVKVSGRHCHSGTGAEAKFVFVVVVGFFFFFFWSHHIPCEILVSPPGIKPTAEAQCLNHWTAREVPSLAYFEFHWMPPTPPLSFQAVCSLFFCPRVRVGGQGSLPWPPCLQSAPLQPFPRGIYLHIKGTTTLSCSTSSQGSLSSVQFSHSVVSNSLRPHGLQHSRPPCPSPTPGVYSNSYPLSQ